MRAAPVFCMLFTLMLPKIAAANSMNSRSEPQAVAAPTQAVVARQLELPEGVKEAAPVPPPSSSLPKAPTKTVNRESAKPQPKPAPLPVTQNSVNAFAPIPKMPTGLAAIVSHTQETAPPKLATVAAPLVATKTENIPAITSVPAESQPAKSEALPKETGFFAGLRNFMIRWRDMLDILFTAAIAGFSYLLYRVSVEQKRLLERSVIAAEEAARAAHKSALRAEQLAMHPEFYDESQASLELV